MKKFNYFLLLAIISLISTNTVNAFTTNSNINSTIEQVSYLEPAFSNQSNLLIPTINEHVEVDELQVSVSSSAEFIQNNLTLLYSICIALVLFNLVAQVKIIIQMVNLFFQFQKKDEFINYNFQ